MLRSAAAVGLRGGLPIMPDTIPAAPNAPDPQVGQFLQHLATDRGASVYTRRNYEQALREFSSWHTRERQAAPPWIKLERDDFRSYLRFPGRKRLGRAVVRLRSEE